MSLLLSSDCYIIEFKYIFDRDREIFILCDHLNIKNLDELKAIKTGKAYIRKPHWAIMHDIHRLSSFKNPLNYRKTFLVPDKLKNEKLKQFIISIEDHNGEKISLDDDNVGNIYPELAIFLLNKIEDFIQIDYSDTGLSQAESKQLAYDCFTYYSESNKQSGSKGDSRKIPPPPSIVLVKRLSEMLHISPDEIKKLSKKTIDEIFIDLEQYNLAASQISIGGVLKKKSK